MAGVVKGAQQVSNGIPADPDPVCVSPTTLFDAFNNPQPEDNSLQDMIESELAFRMSSGAEEDDASSPSEDPVVLNGVHEFLERERSQCSESASPSISVSCSEEQAAPLCSGDDFDDVLGASEPADSDFSPNIHAEQDVDEGTVAEGESLGDMDPERKSLLDLDPLEAELDGCNQPEPVDVEGRPAETATSDPDDSARSAELEDDAPGNNESGVVNSMSECVAILEGQDSWSTVGEALMHQVDSSSETETLSETSEAKTIKKKKITENGDGTVTKKKSKKNKKSDCEKENISVKSSFSKFDQLSKKTVLHVRSVDASKVQKQFNDSATASPESQSTCKSCGKQVFVMEQIKAEKAVWHKNCFRCKECCKQLTVDTYSSHEGELYCKPHFRELFKPKAVIEQETEPVRRRRPEMIIRENQPVELPPDVVRASDKPDLGLEELSSLNVKSRFQVFEKSESTDNDMERSPSTVNVKRSPSILSKLAKFQAKGMDIGVTDDSLNGIHYEESSTSSEEEEEEDEQESDVVKSNSKIRERPMSFTKMEDIKCRWESGATQKEERREERKQEIQNIRSRLFMGKQGKMKEMYEQAVKESEQPGQRKGAEVRSEKAKSIKEKFEKGEPLVSADEDDEKDKKNKDDELSVFEAGISKKSRSLFMELDATAAKAQPLTPPKTSNKDESRKTREMDSPERDVYRDPDLVRADDPVAEDGLVNSQTASKMLSIFRQMEEKATKEDLPDGPKPLKRFTPPPDYTKDSGSSEEESSEEEDSEEEDETDHANSGVIRASDKVEDEFLKAAKEAAKAKTLRAKFEHWEEQENNVNTGGGNLNSPLLESEQDSIESTKSLRARFESLKAEAEQPKEKARPKVNRFVEIQTNCAEFCAACEKKVYPLEKVETGGRLFHKQCFRCLQCCTVLRMETYTLNNGKLYCIPHFKQLFISKGNYDEGFGLDQHKMKWNRENNTNGDLVLTDIQCNGSAQ